MNRFSTAHTDTGGDPDLALHRRAPRGAGPRNGLTLIELLAGLAITVLLVGAAFGLFFSIQRTVERQLTQQNTAGAVDHALTLLREDLSSALIPGGTSTVPFSLDTTPPSTWTLRVCSTTPTGAPDAWRRYAVHQVSYTFQPESNGPGYRLLIERGMPPPSNQISGAETFSLSSADPERRDTPSGAPPSSSRNETITLRLDHPLTLEVYGLSGWTNQWPPESSAALPLAARAQTGRFGNAVTPRMECLIPAGHSIAVPTPKP